MKLFLLCLLFAMEFLFTGASAVVVVDQHRLDVLPAMLVWAFNATWTLTWIREELVQR